MTTSCGHPGPWSKLVFWEEASRYTIKMDNRVLSWLRASKTTMFWLVGPQQNSFYISFRRQKNRELRLVWPGLFLLDSQNIAKFTFFMHQMTRLSSTRFEVQHSHNTPRLQRHNDYPFTMRHIVQPHPTVQEGRLHRRLKTQLLDGISQRVFDRSGRQQFRVSKKKEKV